MARRKKIENETAEQAEHRLIFEHISDKPTRSEKVSWERKMDNMVSLIARITPIEDQILELMAQKTPIFDEVSALRIEMVKDCIHPYTHLVLMADHVVCKFCNHKISIVK